MLGNNLKVSLYVIMTVFFLFLSKYSVDTKYAFAQVNRYWVALLPNTITDANGFVGFKFNDDFKELIYTVNVHSIDNITGVYLYLKNDTQAKSPVLDLLSKPRESNRESDRCSNTTKEGEITGTINLTGITKKDLTGPLSGKSVEHILKLMREDQLYIAVYTKDHPNAELRGDSFIGMDDVFHDADEFNWWCIIYDSFISFKQVKEYLEILNGINLLNYDSKSKIYSITANGLKSLELYEKLDAMCHIAERTENKKKLVEP